MILQEIEKQVESFVPVHWGGVLVMLSLGRGRGRPPVTVAPLILQTCHLRVAAAGLWDSALITAPGAPCQGWCNLGQRHSVYHAGGIMCCRVRVFTPSHLSGTGVLFCSNPAVLQSSLYGSVNLEGRRGGHESNDRADGPLGTGWFALPPGSSGTDDHGFALLVSSHCQVNGGGWGWLVVGWWGWLVVGWWV